MTNLLTKSLLIASILAAISFPALAADEYGNETYEEAQDACYEIAEQRATEQDWQEVVDRCLTDRGFKPEAEVNEE